MKKINIKWLIRLFLILLLIMGCYYGFFIYGNESLSRMYYELRKAHLFLRILICIPFFIPILILVLYIIFRKKIKEKLNTSNFLYTIIILVIMYLIAGTLCNCLVAALLNKGILGYCNVDLEPIPSGLLGPCFLSGMEYAIMMFYLFLPPFIIVVFEMLIGLYKKIFKKS